MLKRTLQLNIKGNLLGTDGKLVLTPEQNVTLTTYFPALAAPPCHVKGTVPRD
jgi:hypothetical protein